MPRQTAETQENAETTRLEHDRLGQAAWRRWGPYLSERQWGTVREDYSPDGAAWDYLPHDHARSRAYRWGEDGIAGICDDQQRLCLSLALWNGRDPILKERLFGLTNSEANHGEDVKELYYYLDATPTHSYLKMLYKYPQAEFPYKQLVDENRRRGKDQPEYELLDTGVFDENRYFDVFVEYAKAGPDDILMLVTVHNRGPEAAEIHVLPQIWFRNTWSWGAKSAHAETQSRGEMRAVGWAAPAGNAHAVSARISGHSPPCIAAAHHGRDAAPGQLGGHSPRYIAAAHATLGEYRLFADGAAMPLFCENETNAPRLFGTDGATRFPKDAFHEFVVHGRTDAVNPEMMGTKAGLLYRATVPAGGKAEFRLRLQSKIPNPKSKTELPAQLVRESLLAPDRRKASPTALQTRRPPAGMDCGDVGSEKGISFQRPFRDFDAVMEARRREADEFYAGIQAGAAHADSGAADDARLVQRQAFAGLIWSKQFFYYDVPEWLSGDPRQPAPPVERRRGRNHEWTHLNNADVISMPDKWEYPWYAAWDLAFHCIPFAQLDPEFAKSQLVLLTREWYMHPNGQLPAYEWAFGDVNPPVHAWATWRVFQIDRKQRRRAGDPNYAGDLAFLERVFHKLMLNFTWWVNRKDAQGRNVFQGGFLGMDNIGVFDRSAALPTGGFINQADGTSWMAMYCLNLMRIALELARHNHVYEDIATKFFEHFLHIAEAMDNIGGDVMQSSASHRSALHGTHEPTVLPENQEPTAAKQSFALREAVDAGARGEAAATRPSEPATRADACDGVSLWCDDDQFFYDVLNLPTGAVVPLKVRSMVGLIPLFAVETLEPELLDELPEFKRRLEWFLNYKPELAALVSRWDEPGRGRRRLLALLRGHRMKAVLRRMLDETEFLSPYGVRSLSKAHGRDPYVFWSNGSRLEVRYQPAESDSGLFGGNSNWRGPIWFPVNYLIIESLQKFHHYYGDDFKIECPTGSGVFMTIGQVADELSRRLRRIFLRGANGKRPVSGSADQSKIQNPKSKIAEDPNFRDYILFHEYFDGDNGRGVGASHQCGWTALVAKLLLPRDDQKKPSDGSAVTHTSASKPRDAVRGPSRVESRVGAAHPTPPR